MERRKRMAKKTNLKNGGRGRKQTFAFAAPEAMSVQLVGDFTHWQECPISLHKGLDGVWRTTVELEPGTHHYRFLVDGQWRDDPECILRAPNPYGSENMMRRVA
jgi:1,4-alpha-glucan branching enzyme